MKTILPLIAVGMCAAIQSASGQAVMTFNNEGPITYANANVPAGKEGQAVEADFGLALLFAPGVHTTLAELSVTPGLGWDFTPGYFSGNVSIPGVLGGQMCTFAVVAWATSGPYAEGGYNLNPTSPVLQGASSLWTEVAPPSIPTPPPGPRGIAFTVQIVPEPSVLALSALGISALWTVRRPRRQ